MNEGAAALLFEMRCCCTRHVKGAVKVYIDNLLPLLFTHFEDEPIPNNACVVDHTVDATIVIDRKSTRLNSSHVRIAYAVFCLKKKKKKQITHIKRKIIQDYIA